MKKTPAVIAGAGAVSIAGLMLTMVQWTSSALEQKADRSEVVQITHNIDKLDSKLNQILWHLVSMKHAMDNKRVHIVSEENGVIPN